MIHVPSLDKFFNAASVKIAWFGGKKVIEPLFQFFVVVEGDASEMVRKRAEEMEV